MRSWRRFALWMKDRDIRPAASRCGSDRPSDARPPEAEDRHERTKDALCRPDIFSVDDASSGSEALSALRRADEARAQRDRTASRPLLMRELRWPRSAGRSGHSSLGAGSVEAAQLVGRTLMIFPARRRNWAGLAKCPAS